MPEEGSSRNPFYSGRFFHSRELGVVDFNAVKSQSLLFRSVFSLPATPRGRDHRRGGSQSLLFRSVFSLAAERDMEILEARMVAIPSIQVGFFTRPRPPQRWQSRKVAIPSIQVGFFTPLRGMPGAANWIMVAIPSIQVGFFTHEGGENGRAGKVCRNPFYSGRFFHSILT